MSASFRALIACASLALLPCAHAEQRTTAQREDGAVTPLVVFEPQAASSACPPLALISPGAGGTENGLAYIGEALSKDGWRAIVLGHKESGPQALRKDMFRSGLHRGLENLVADPEAYRGRFMDIGAALKWSEQRCHAPFKALVGHSMGARTVMLEAGAKNSIGLRGANRFDAYMALSEPGADAVFPDGAARSVTAPVLMLTGTRDNTIDQGGWQERAKTFDELGSSCAWMGVVDGASHMNMAGSGFGAKDAAENAVITMGTRFLDDLRAGRCGQPPRLAGVAIRTK
jgi:dienelactone hydrolase